MSPIPEDGGKGQRRGCYRCGKPSSTRLSVVAGYVGAGVKGRGNKSVSRMRTFCEECGDTVWDEMFERLEARP